MQTAQFEFDLPPDLIAQVPAPRRDQSRLMVLHRDTGAIEHRAFRDLPGYLQAGDVLVANDSCVLPARLRGWNANTGGAFEALLLEQNALNDWWVMLRPARRARVGTVIDLRDGNGRPSGVQATVIATNAEGHRRLRFSGTADILQGLAALGETPLPPYILRPAGLHPLDLERYQTVYAREPGSVAAPTAGLHFTKESLADLQSRAVQVCFLTLHVGLGTFAPVKVERVSAHTMHEERFDLTEATVQAIQRAKAAGRRVVCVGTTTVRVLESVAARHRGQLAPGAGRTSIFIYPPCAFSIADVLLTNFHLPRSTLLMLVSAFAAPGCLHGRDLVLAAYAEAVRQRYRFFSYGDAMLIL